jgi:hypothetical protein
VARPERFEFPNLWFEASCGQIQIACLASLTKPETPSDPRDDTQRDLGVRSWNFFLIEDGSSVEAMSNQRTGWCCIDWLNWQPLTEK